MVIDAEFVQLSKDGRCFYLRRYYLVVGVACAVFCAAMGVVTAIAVRRPPPTTLLATTGWSAFALLGVWLIRAYFRESLLLASSIIVQQGVFRSRALDVENVRQIDWRRLPAGGSLVVRTESEKIKIYLDNFANDDREAIIRFFWETFANEIHRNWAAFEERTRKLADTTRTAPRSSVLVFSLIFTCFAGLFIYCWLAGIGVQYLFIGLINAAAAVWCLWRRGLVKNRSLMEEPESKQ